MVNYPTRRRLDLALQKPGFHVTLELGGFMGAKLATVKTAIKTVERWLATAADALHAPAARPVLVPVPVRGPQPPARGRRKG